MDDGGDVNTPFGCPHCKAPLPGASPGVVHCTRCGGAATIPSQDQLARQAKKRADDSRILMVIGAIVFAVYVLPVLAGVGYACFVMVIALLMTLGSIAAAAGG